MALSAETIAQLAYQAGFREPVLSQMVAVARRESGYNPTAWRTDSPGKGTGDVGLWQINYVNLPALRSIGITSMNQLLDPETNARAAKFLYDRSGFQPWTAGPGGWTAGGNHLYGTNLDAAKAAVANAQRQGLLGEPYSGGGDGVGSAIAAGAAPGAPVARTVELPSDAQIHVIDGTFDVFAVFNVNGVNVAYRVELGEGRTSWLHMPRTVVSADQWNQMRVVDAGSTDELATVTSTFGNYRSYWDSILGQVMGYNNPARNDPEVLRVLAEFSARPDMEPAELQNKLQATQWFQQRTQGELEYNSLSEAEKTKRQEESRARAIEIWQQYLGQRLGEGDPRVANYVEQLASGKLGWGAFTELVKKAAADTPESPFFREQRSEQEAQLQRGIDIENTAQNIRQTLDRWGLQWTNDEVMRWAKGIMEKTFSDDDLMNQVQASAAVLYPWKDPQMETLQAAQPWLQTYERVFEQKGTLRTTEIAQALGAGEQPWEFEKRLKNDARWLGTRNGQDEMYSLVGSVGRLMGFE
jgi:hypothetical protein